MGQSLYASKDTDEDQEYTPIQTKEDVKITPKRVSYGDGCNDSVPSTDKKEA